MIQEPKFRYTLKRNPHTRQLNQSISDFYMEILVNQNIFIVSVQVHKVWFGQIIIGMPNTSLLSSAT